MIGLSLDEEPTAPARYAAEHGMTWHQGFLGDWQVAKLPHAFGVQGIPSIMLIGPAREGHRHGPPRGPDQGGRGRRPGEVNPRRRLRIGSDSGKKVKEKRSRDGLMEQKWRVCRGGIHPMSASAARTLHGHLDQLFHQGSFAGLSDG